tara:strand:+ start:1180 stop:1734 length:555 start_codon:yes stop_codon:yes gene_type:complete
MARQKYNHNRRIEDLQPAKVKSVYPGTIVQFKYKGDKIFDKNPMVLILWNDYEDYKIHGINMNYLSEFNIKRLFQEIMEVKGNILVEEDQKSGGQGDVGDETYDDNLPYRNLLKDPYTRIKLPTYREERGGNPLSRSEAMTQMNRLYEKKLKRIIKKHDIYRSYMVDKMDSIKVVTYDIEGLLK